MWGGRRGRRGGCEEGEGEGVRREEREKGRVWGGRRGRRGGCEEGEGEGVRREEREKGRVWGGRRGRRGGCEEGEGDHFIPCLLSGNSEDRTIKVWDMTRRSAIHSFRRESDRFWALAAHPTLSVFAAGTCDQPMSVLYSYCVVCACVCVWGVCVVCVFMCVCMCVVCMDMQVMTMEC